MIEDGGCIFACDIKIQRTDCTFVFVKGIVAKADIINYYFQDLFLKAWSPKGRRGKKHFIRWDSNKGV